MRTAALVVLAVAGFGLAACGSGGKPAAHYTPPPGTTQGGTGLTVTSPTTLTVASARTGATVRCINHGVATGATVPAPGHGVTGIADGTSASATIGLARNSDGSLVVSCKP